MNPGNVVQAKGPQSNLRLVRCIDPGATINSPKPSNNIIKSPSCIDCSLRKRCLAGEQNSHWLAELDQLVVHNRPMRKGKHLYWQDSPFRSVYMIHSGAVKSYRLSASGKERVLGFYLPGELIGIDGLCNNRYSNSVMTLDTSTVCEFPFKPFLELLEHAEPLHRRFLSYMCSELLEEQEMTFLCQKSTDERVVTFLLNLSNRLQRRHLSAFRFQLLMTRKDIANYLGIATETISRVLSRFQDRGWLKINGRELTLINMAAMEELLQGSKDEG